MSATLSIKRSLSTLAVFFLGLALGGYVTGFIASPMPSPDASAELGRFEDEITRVASKLLKIGLTLSFVAIASRFLVVDTISKKKTEPEL
jgi:hypothetical protein